MEPSQILKNIPKNRLLIYLVVLGLLPLLFILFLFVSKLDDLDDLQNSIQSMQALALQREKKQSVNIALRNNYLEADHFYIDKSIESIQLLQPEIENLKKIASNPNFPEDPNVRKRIDFLTSPQNRLTFSEGSVQSTPFFQETVETLTHPVEIDTTDLQKILTAIEGVEIGAFAPDAGRPQLIILDFKLEKKNVGDKNEVFGLNMKILKREFL